jgi:5-deoxy-glucuronate isomerase
MRYLSLGVVRLESGEIWEAKTAAGREAALVLLQGAGTLSVGSKSAKARRDDLWKDGAWFAYAPAGESLLIKADAPTEAVVTSADAPEGQGPAGVFGPESVRCRQVGTGNYERRVCDLLSGQQPAGRLLFGETFNPPGHWSSFPPHRHERHNPPVEAEMEEVYYFRTRPTEGFGFQRMYTDDGEFDVSMTVTDGDVLKIPRGYHPVSAMPGYDLYYFWVLAGRGRQLIPFTDPRYDWLLPKR